MPDLITPLGGVLVNRHRLTFADDGSPSPSPSLSLDVSDRAAADLELLGNGAYSPLKGFLTRADYQSVVHHAQLADGTPWTLPITCSVSRDTARSVKEGETVSLRDGRGLLRGMLTIRDVFQRDSEVEAREGCEHVGDCRNCPRWALATSSPGTVTSSRPHGTLELR